MDLIDSVKSMAGVVDDRSYKYECQDCQSAFETETEPESFWLSCPKCGSEDYEMVEDRTEAFA